YQGIYPKTVLSELLDLSELYFTQEGLEFYGQVSFLKAGLAFSDRVTTVSQTYAQEIQCSYYGERLDGYLRKRAADLKGILNGIDRDVYNPETDPHLVSNFKDYEGKLKNKLALQREVGLPEDETIPVLAMVTRLVEQKGIDLVLGVFHELMQLNSQIVILGTGDYQYEWAFRELANQYPDKVSFHNYFSEPLSRRIYAGSDLFIMPSKFEPCGIGQLLAFRYGTLPVVRETGGLKDTVDPYNEFTGEGNGFSFTNYNAHDMLYTIERAVWLYRFQPKTWRGLAEKAMSLDFSWSVSAGDYKQVYEALIMQESIHQPV
ncbi:MAG TPA: glycogen/starch synthase, partial [Sporolactobacillaceae bacterium]|nr:glycogen/starch synthase [Sporolactobacillaceae bacterium]